MLIDGTSTTAFALNACRLTKTPSVLTSTAVLCTPLASGQREYTSISRKQKRVEQLVGERGHDTQRQHSQRRCQPPKASASLRLPSRPCSPLRSIGAWRPELEAGGWRGREMLAQATLCKLPHPLSSYSAAAMIRPIFFRQCSRKAARILTPNMVVHM